MNWTEDELRRYCAARGVPLPAGMAPGADPAHGKQPGRSKYNNRRTELDGKTYDSAREAGRAAELKLLVAAGEIAAVLEQVNFRLPGGVVYRADFVLLKWDGTFTVEDAKGVRTKEYSIKRRLMREKGLDIKEV
jgi:hypothetical protein